MAQFRFLLSLITRESDYQTEEAAECSRQAQQLGVDLQIVYAEADAVTQSQQLLEALYARGGPRYNGMIVQPVGTSMPQIAQAANADGIAWAILNRDADYLDALRRTGRAPACAVTSDHVEIGRIQGRQMAALCPKGGMALYLEGPSASPTAQQRKQGMLETKPSELQLRSVRAQWGRHGAQTAVAAWLRLSTSRQAHCDLVAGQSDSMTIGARDAIEADATLGVQSPWLRVPFLGCDGCKNTGQAWTDEGLLTATVRMPLLSGIALQLLVKGLLGESIDARTLLPPSSYPPVEQVARKHASGGH